MTRVDSELEEYLILPPLPTTTRGYGLHIGGTLSKKKRLLYCSGNLVIQRMLDSLSSVVMNPLHSTRATTAQFSPSGEWVCSGDESGAVRVWADGSLVQKGEGVTVGRAVLDISWSADGQRIVAVGRGKEEKGKVFPWNSGGKLGEITGATAALLACAFKPTRPYRVVASSEDFGVFFYKGPPFKYESHDRTHKNYANSVRYSPSGEYYLTCASDKKLLLFDGKSGALLRTLATGDKKKQQHTGSIYEVSWAPDSRRFVTASADKTCKLWDLDSGTVLHTWQFGMRRACDKKPGVGDMQVACLWLGEQIVSVSLSGHINFLSQAHSAPALSLTGHQKAVVSLAVDSSKALVYSADLDGRVVRTDGHGAAEDLIGSPHAGNALKLLALSCDCQALYSVANDDRICLTSVADTSSLPLSFGSDDFKEPVVAAKLQGAGRCMATGNADEHLVAVGTHTNKVLLFAEALELKQTLELCCTPSALHFSSDDRLLAVGGEDCNVYLYALGAEGCFALRCRICTPALMKRKIVSVGIQPTGKYLASADANRQIWLWDLQQMTDSADSGLESEDVFRPANEMRSFQFHRAMPSAIRWSPDGQKLASCGHDSQIFVWTTAAEAANHYIRLEHSFFDSVRDVQWLSDDQLVAAGTDATVRFFKIVHRS